LGLDQGSAIAEVVPEDAGFLPGGGCSRTLVGEVLDAPGMVVALPTGDQAAR
jgi:hypothetical protein